MVTSSSTYRANALEGGRIQVAEDVGLRIIEDLERHGAVVVLERRDVVVANRQLRARVDLIPTYNDSHIDHVLTTWTNT